MKNLRPLAAVALVLLAGCTAETDLSRYAVGDDGTATFENASPIDAFLDGCSPFGFQKRSDGGWADYGLGPVCLEDVIEGSPGSAGLPEVVPPGGSADADFAAPDEPGIYRLRFPTGVGCAPDAPVSPASCRSVHPVDTPAFRVAELCNPDDIFECGPQPGMPNFLCPDGVHVAGPTGRCLRDPEALFCGWEIVGCPD